MQKPSALSELPSIPAVYALYGGQGKSAYVAYVGLATQLKPRILQHLVMPNSSVTAGVSAVTLKPEYVTRVEWWEYPDFVDGYVLMAAELIAFDVLDPVLRSRGSCGLTISLS